MNLPNDPPSRRTVPLPPALRAVLIGPLVGAVFGSAVGVRHAVAQGETEIVEILQWGVLPAAGFGGLFGMLIGGLGGLIMAMWAAIRFRGRHR